MISTIIYDKMYYYKISKTENKYTVLLTRGVEVGDIGPVVIGSSSQATTMKSLKETRIRGSPKVKDMTTHSALQYTKGELGRLTL